MAKKIEKARTLRMDARRGEKKKKKKEGENSRVMGKEKSERQVALLAGEKERKRGEGLTIYLD